MNLSSKCGLESAVVAIFVKNCIHVYIIVKQRTIICVCRSGKEELQQNSAPRTWFTVLFHLKFYLMMATFQKKRTQKINFKRWKGMTPAACIWYKSSTKSGNKNKIHHPSSSAVHSFLWRPTSRAGCVSAARWGGVTMSSLVKVADLRLDSVRSVKLAAARRRRKETGPHPRPQRNTGSRAAHLWRDSQDSTKYFSPLSGIPNSCTHIKGEFGLTFRQKAVWYRRLSCQKENMMLSIKQHRFTVWYSTPVKYL